jgi:hypothetical protein
MTPAVQRMELAMRTPARMKVQGLAPRIRWEPTVQIVSGAGEPLQHPAGCLLECVFILRDEHPYQGESVADTVTRRMNEALAHTPRRGPGGVA